MANSQIIVRHLPPAEWCRLEEIYRSQSDTLPLADQNTAVVAESDGRIIGMFGLNLILHAGPIWVDPKWRGQGISHQMAKSIDELAKTMGSAGYFMFPSNTRSESVAMRLGLQRLELKVYQRGF